MTTSKYAGSFLPTGDILEGGWVYFKPMRIGDDVQGEFIEDESGDGKGPWLVYQMDISREPNPKSEWYGDKLSSVESYVGREKGSLAKDLAQNNSWEEQARAYADLVSYHGAANFDSDPLRITSKSELRKRYASAMRK